MQSLKTAPRSAHTSRIAPVLCVLFSALTIPAAARPANKPPLDFKVLKVGEPVTGIWELVHPWDGVRTRVEIRPSGPGEGSLVGTLVPSGVQILNLAPKTEGIGYRGEMSHLLANCGQERVAISDFVPLGDRVLVQIDTKPPQIPCPFLESPLTSRYFIAATVNPVRLRGIGEITSDKTREQIGLGGQREGASTPIVGDAVSVEGGTEVKYRGRVRSLDGSIWVEVEGMVSPAAGIEPPRGYLTSESLRVLATLTLTRPQAPATAPGTGGH
jgi:hypothetical protein